LFDSCLPACPVAPEDGTGVGAVHRTGVNPVQETINEIKNKIIWLPSFLASCLQAYSTGKILSEQRTIDAKASLSRTSLT